ncbi:MAG: helix-turn-helix domain-containing protein [Bacteroidota bacterium]
MKLSLHLFLISLLFMLDGTLTAGAAAAQTDAEGEYGTIYVFLDWEIVAFCVMVLSILGYFIYVDKPRSPQHQTLNRIKDEMVGEIDDALRGIMTEQEPYLNSELTLSQLAALISISDKDLSYFLNRHLQTNFYDFINKFRIDAFLTKMQNQDYGKYSMTGVALECGFKSKSSFYRAFKKQKGASPKAYILGLQGYSESF